MSLPAEAGWRPGERRHAEHGEDVPRAVAGGRAQDAGLSSRQVYDLNIGRSNVRLESVKTSQLDKFQSSHDQPLPGRAARHLALVEAGRGAGDGLEGEQRGRGGGRHRHPRQRVGRHRGLGVWCSAIVIRTRAFNDISPFWGENGKDIPFYNLY